MSESTLAEHLFNISHGTPVRGIKTISSATYTTGAASYIIAPSTGKRLVIMHINAAAGTIGGGGLLDLSLMAAGSSTPDETIFQDLRWAAQYPVDMDLSSCPIFCSTNQTVKGVVAAGNTVVVTIVAFEVD